MIDLEPRGKLSRYIRFTRGSHANIAPTSAKTDVALSGVAFRKAKAILQQ
jgi:hypothetical protein